MQNLQTKPKKLNGVFDNIIQDFLSDISIESRDAFIKVTTPATDDDIRHKLEDEQKHFEDNYTNDHALN